MRDDNARNEADDAVPGGSVYSLRVEPAGLLIDVRSGESVLEAAARAGWQLPSSCRNGTCRACLCQLLAGDIRYRVDWPGLSAEEKRSGWMLPCVALPGSNIAIEQPGALPAAAPAARRPGRGF
ncbi:MAG: 2Fe-2S iron-sulfur cluster-binding protein [Janthinobacterium lividum]